MTTAPPKLSPMSWAALVLGGAALVILAMQGSKLARALFMPSAGVGDVRKTVEEQAQRYAASFDPQMAQINGRQLFLMPVPAPVIEVDDTPDEPIDTTPRAPTVYTGPSVVAMINDVVWFSNGVRVAKGDRDGDIKVIDIDAPWSAQVEWRGSEFTVKLFDRDAVILPTSERSDSRRTPVVAAPALAPAPEKPRPSEPAPMQTGTAPAAGSPPAAPAPEAPPVSPAPEHPEPPLPEPMPPQDIDPNQGGFGPADPSPGEPPPESARAPEISPTK